MPDYIALYELMVSGSGNKSKGVPISKHEYGFSVREPNKKMLRNEVESYLKTLNTAGNIGEWRFVRLSRLVEEILPKD